MTDLRKAAEMALLTLEGWNNHGEWVWPESALFQSKRNTVESIEALRQALAQPEQEPVAWMQDSVELYVKDFPSFRYTIPLYTAPPKREWVGLTEQEVDAIREDIFTKHQMALLTSKDITNENNYSAFNFYRAIEEKLRSKND